MLVENMFESVYQAGIFLLLVSSKAQSNQEDPNIHQLLLEIKSLLESQSVVLEKLSRSSCTGNVTHLQEQLAALQNERKLAMAPLVPAPPQPVVTQAPSSSHDPSYSPTSGHSLSSGHGPSFGQGPSSGHGPISGPAQEPHVPHVPHWNERDAHQAVTTGLPRLEGALEKLKEQIGVLYTHLVAAQAAPMDDWNTAKADVSDLHDAFGLLVKHKSYMAAQEAIWERWGENLEKYDNMVNMIDVVADQFIKCKDGFKQIGDTCYLYNLDDRFTLNEAMLSCKAVEGRLLELNTEREYHEVLSRTKGHNIWLGLKADFLGDWRWMSNNQLTKFTEWYTSPVRSSGNCAYIDNTGQTGWFNYHCTTGRKNPYKIYSICQSEGQNIKEFLHLKQPTEF